ncbi:hypothetical protein M8818_000320 [Zalaria obscura]|uniref:Uncharacterized protein n=1 Tax=Zalaria obscura TaxID=2024903 RepID=A0ACC3SPH8_9PEZI
MGFIGGCCLALIALFIPPLPVLIRAGCGASFFVSIILTLLGWLPGVLYAWFVIMVGLEFNKVSVQPRRSFAALSLGCEQAARFRQVRCARTGE